MVDTPRSIPASKRQSHAEKKAATRRQVIDAALDIFSRDGYAKASLDAIADHAGYSKGAIYSNFSSKADLFLAAMDTNIQGLDPECVEIEDQLGEDLRAVTDEQIKVMAKQATEGFGLATLEFITVALRDPGLRQALSERIQRVIARHEAMIGRVRNAKDPVPAHAVASLVVAFDFGMDILQLLGISGATLGLSDVGRQRIINPKAAVNLAIDPAATDQTLRQAAEVEAIFRKRLGR